jgi:hypothetical protein
VSRAEEFRPYDWTDDRLANANDASAAIGGKSARIFSGNEINALICEVQAWRRFSPLWEFVPGVNVIRERTAK